MLATPYTSYEAQHRVELAQIITKFVHCGQKHGERDYYEHLKDVHSVLLRFGYKDTDLIVAAYFHDAIEDQGIKPGLIESTFGTNVMNIVLRVTNEVGANRREKNLKTLPKIAECPQATCLKLADRIANVEADGSMKAKYREEYPHFKGVLKTRGAFTAMWDHLDKLLT